MNQMCVVCLCVMYVRSWLNTKHKILIHFFNCLFMSTHSSEIVINHVLLLQKCYIIKVVKSILSNSHNYFSKYKGVIQFMKIFTCIFTLKTYFKEFYVYLCFVFVCAMCVIYVNRHTMKFV